VLHVITGLGVGGAERALVNLATSDRNAHRPLAVAALVGDGPNRENLERSGVAVFDLGMRRGHLDLSAMVRLAKLIRARRPAVVQSWMYHADLLSLVALWLSGRRSATRLLWSIRCSNMDTRRYRLLFAATVRAWKTLARFPDAVVANSDAGISAHRALGCRLPHVFRIDNGVNIQRFRPDPDRRAEFRQWLGIGEGTLVVAAIGRVDPMKDHELLLRLVDQARGLVFIAAGRGTESLPDRPALRRLGESDHVPQILAASDMFLATSRFGEGFPNVVAEAMSCGVPVVATDVGDTRRIVGDTGIVVPVGDEAGLNDALRRLAAEDDLRQRLGVAARRRVAECFTVEQMVDKFGAAYDALLSPEGRGAPAGRPELLR
jgi:glycosyltransferase involved in cell wall biosynthesis